MNLRCETHRMTDGQAKEAVAVCHHCGKPLCNTFPLYDVANQQAVPKNILCGYTILDPAFYYYADELPPKAHHCEKCIAAYHPEFSQTLQRLKASR